MAHQRKEFKALTAPRTGLPVQDKDEYEQPEGTKSAWLVVIALAIAFALVLRMEAEDAHPEPKQPTFVNIVTPEQVAFR